MLRSECKSIVSVQGSGFEGDAVLYSTWLLGLDWREEGRKGSGEKGGMHVRTYKDTDRWKICPIVLYRTEFPSEPLPKRIYIYTVHF